MPLDMSELGRESKPTPLRTTTKCRTLLYGIKTTEKHASAAAEKMSTKCKLCNNSLKLVSHWAATVGDKLRRNSPESFQNVSKRLCVIAIISHWVARNRRYVARVLNMFKKFVRQSASQNNSLRAVKKSSQLSQTRRESSYNLSITPSP